MSTRERPRVPVEIHDWPALMDMPTVALYCSVSTETVTRWYAEGGLQPHELPGTGDREKLDKVVFSKKEIRRFVGLKL